MQIHDALIWLNSIPGMGGVRTRAVQDHFGTAEAILSADETSLARVKGIGAKVARAIRASDPEAFLEKEYAAAEKGGIRIITTEDPEYPAGLKAMPPAATSRAASIDPPDAVAGRSKTSG